MSRRIEITVDGCVVSRSSKTAGTQGEGNVTTLRVSFDESWKGMGKRIIWRDATGLNPASVLLFDPEAGSDTLRYGTLIPAEPLALPGWCSATIEGYTTDENGVLQVARTVELRLQVLMNDGFYAPAEPTASEVAQIYDRLGTAEENLQTYTAICSDAAEVCTEKRAELDTITALNKTYADRAKFYADAVEHAALGLEQAEADISVLQDAMADKLDANLGTEHDGKFLVIDENGDIVPGTIDGGGLVTSVCGETGAVELTTDHIIADDDTLTAALAALAPRSHLEEGGKLWAVSAEGDLTFVDAVDDTLSRTGIPADAAAVGQRLAALPVQTADDGYTDISQLRKPTALNLLGWASGSFSVTLDGSVTEHFLVSFDDNGRPVTVTDADGHETAVIWG